MPSSRSHLRSLATDLLNESGGWEITAERQAEVAEASFERIDRALMIPIERIAPMRDNPRQSFRHLDELAESIEDRGLIQPLVVRRDPDRPGYFMTVAGARRLMAANILRGSEHAETRARVATLPCLVADETDDHALASALAENLARDDLTRAEAMDAMLRLQEQYGWSARQIAKRTGRDHSDVSELVRVAKDPELSSLVRDDVIAASTAGEISNLEAHDRARVIEEVQAGRIRTTRDVRTLKARRRSQLEPIRQSGATVEGHAWEFPHLTDNDLEGDQPPPSTHLSPSTTAHLPAEPADGHGEKVDECPSITRDVRLPGGDDEAQATRVREHYKAIRAAIEARPILAWEPEILALRSGTEELAERVSGRPRGDAPVPLQMAAARIRATREWLSSLGDLPRDPQLEAELQQLRTVLDELLD